MKLKWKKKAASSSTLHQNDFFRESRMGLPYTIINLFEPSYFIGKIKLNCNQDFLKPFIVLTWKSPQWLVLFKTQHNQLTPNQVQFYFRNSVRTLKEGVGVWTRRSYFANIPRRTIFSDQVPDIPFFVLCYATLEVTFQSVVPSVHLSSAKPKLFKGIFDVLKTLKKFRPVNNWVPPLPADLRHPQALLGQSIVHS